MPSESGPPAFADPVDDKTETETGTVFRPRFSADGLLTAVVTDADTGAVVMLAHMNAQALSLSLDTGIAHYWSRSRGRLWKKGETSGNLQRIVTMHTDCDQDAVLLAVRTQGDGANCHTGRRSCFYRRLATGPDHSVTLVMDDDDAGPTGKPSG